MINEWQTINKYNIFKNSIPDYHWQAFLKYPPLTLDHQETLSTRIETKINWVVKIARLSTRVGNDRWNWVVNKTWIWLEYKRKSLK